LRDLEEGKPMGRRRPEPIPTAAAHDVARLAERAVELAHLERLIRAHVEEARERGATWRHIGNALDISPQGAQQRFGR
jgi:hypothetical protein